MEIKINFTLLIQACNFLVAYIILRRFLLKPVIHVIDQEKVELHTLIATVDSRKIIMMQKETEKKERWYSYQKQFAAHIPSFVSGAVAPIFKHISPDFVPKFPSQEDRKMLIDSMTRVLLQKVSHDS